MRYVREYTMYANNHVVVVWGDGTKSSGLGAYVKGKLKFAYDEGEYLISSNPDGAFDTSYIAMEL